MPLSAFEQPLAVAALLAGFEKPWFVAGGWAIDLYLGKVTRKHKDLEIAILRPDQHALRRYLKGWQFTKVKWVPGESHGHTESWSGNEWLNLPIHEIHAHRSAGDPSALEILLNECSGENWVFRRNPEITRPLRLIERRSGLSVPFLAPEIILLYKAKNPGVEDEDDFNRVKQLLDREPRAWLRWAIQNSYPAHPWLESLCP